MQYSQIKPQRRHPDWFKIKLPSGDKFNKIQSLVKTNRLNTICEEAKCPNLSDCWSNGTATFLILGDVCTRYCAYCNVKTGKPIHFDKNEPKKIADAVKKLKLKYAVITSVTRDDLEDGGSLIYAETVNEIKKITSCKVEVLIPDFDFSALKTVIEAKPDVLGHNIEAVEPVFNKVRPKGNYKKSLELLENSKKIDGKIKTKSGLMVGFGETLEEIKKTMKELKNNNVDYLTIGQYLRPSIKHVKIEKYYTPDEFLELKRIGYEIGFENVETGPLVRSSYRADRLCNLLNKKSRI
ncbi:lipoyl synthase [archaeon]|jgi:lipoic acid synthetase|nr:lipoyl synthase [archaeon]MDP6547753.1 lipoyl synthase [Candidatus Woesearchaeota archaeon]|tara:strand:- start:47487 stop:48371 length:885 start_codon:yes stop_codon:yes gene_type:complete